MKGRSETFSSLAVLKTLKTPPAQIREVSMDERQQLDEDLRRYRTIRDLTTDEAALEAIEIMIRETEERLAQLESGPDQV
jgi:hypothetical protein